MRLARAVAVLPAKSIKMLVMVCRTPSSGAWIRAAWATMAKPVHDIATETA